MFTPPTMPEELSPSYLAPMLISGEKWTTRLVLSYNTIAKRVNAEPPLPKKDFEKLLRTVIAAYEAPEVFTREPEEKGVSPEEYEQDIGPLHIVVSPFVASDHVVRALKEASSLMRGVINGEKVDGWTWEDLEEMKEKVQSLLTGIDD